MPTLCAQFRRIVYDSVYFSLFSLTGILIWHSLFHEYYLLPRYFIAFLYSGFRWTGRFLKIIYHWNGWYFIHIVRAVAPRAIWMKSTLLNQLNVSKWPGQQRVNASPFKLFPGALSNAWKQCFWRMKSSDYFMSFRVFDYIALAEARSTIRGFIIGKRCENFLFNLRPNFVSKSNL